MVEPFSLAFSLCLSFFFSTFVPLLCFFEMTLNRLDPPTSCALGLFWLNKSVSYHLFWLVRIHTDIETARQINRSALCVQRCIPLFWSLHWRWLTDDFTFFRSSFVSVNVQQFVLFLSGGFSLICSMTDLLRVVRLDYFSIFCTLIRTPSDVFANLNYVVGVSCFHSSFMWLCFKLSVCF